jgi:hypothetical protein
MPAYDKAKWHFEGDFPKNLPITQGYVHIGFFLGWAVDRGFAGSLLVEDFTAELQQYRNGQISAPRLLEITDGVLDDQILSVEGNLFTSFYYDDYYLAEYHALFPEAKSTYHVEDTLKNILIVKQHLDLRYEAWKTKLTPPN